MELMRLFTHWRNIAIEAMQEAGTIGIVVRWGDESSARSLVRRQAQEVRLEDPEDQIMMHADYEAKYGDFRSNGLGHKEVNWGSVRGILIPGARIWKVKRARIMTAEIQETMDTGDFQLGAGPSRCCSPPLL